MHDHSICERLPCSARKMIVTGIAIARGVDKTWNFGQQMLNLTDVAPDLLPELRDWVTLLGFQA